MELARCLQCIWYPAAEWPTNQRDHAMFNDFARKFAALALTVVMSATCVLTAVGPAEADGGSFNQGRAVATAARFVA
jgi:hypothetical protein